MSKYLIKKIYTYNDAYSRIRNYPNIFFIGNYFVFDNILLFDDYLSTKTYINLIPVAKYVAHSEINNIFIKLCFESKNRVCLVFKLIGIGLDNKKSDIYTEVFYIEENRTVIEIPINIKDFTNIAYFYWEVKVLKNDGYGNTLIKFIPHESGIFTNIAPVIKPKIGIIITTFKREKYVIENMKKLSFAKIFENLDTKIFIIDNGKTLKDKIPGLGLHSNIRIIENNNLGGAGGFGRGLIEILEEEHEITHIVFMDDDIELEPFTIENLYYFLSYANNIGVGGSMLSYMYPYLLWESGAYYSLKNFPHLVFNKHKIQIDDHEELIKLFHEEVWSHYGWWFFCLPKEMFKKVGMPLPVFFRGDDMEYGIRLAKQNIEIIDLPGIFTYHEDFFAKYNAFTDYLVSRNELIIRAIHFNLSTLYEVKHLLFKTLRTLFSYRYETVEMILKGYEDFLKGPDFIMHLEPKYYEDLSKNVIHEKATKIPKGFYKGFLVSRSNPSKVKYKLKRMLHFLTLGSHIIPPFSFRGNNEAILDTDYVILDNLHYFDFSTIFRKVRILFYDPRYQVGYFVNKDSLRFFKILLRLCNMTLKFFYKYGKIRNKYRKKHKEMISLDFWKRYLRITK